MAQEQDPSIQRATVWLQRDMDRTKAWDTLKWETGSWTPTIVGSTGAGTYTYVAQNGSYRRFENMIVVRGRAAISAITVNPTGIMRLSGLPYNADSNFPMSLWYSQIDLSAGCIQLTAMAQGATALVNLWESFDNAASAVLPAAQFILNPNADIIIMGAYFTTS